MHRWFELSLTLCALIVLSLPMLLTAALVFSSLGPPLLFTQHRVGLQGRVFVIRKFRTMTDRRDDTGILLPDAQRVTPLTTLLRRSRLDETPQLFSILSGGMALVGPRPLMAPSIARFGALGAKRCSVRPGLTGWAQVSGNSLLDERDKLSLDLWYVAHRSFALDLRILVETVAVALFGERVNPARIARAQGWLTQSGLTSSSPMAAST